MSNAIDSKVVEMKFDNRDFEANVKNSLSTLDKLKQALNFKGSVKGLNAIEDASKNVKFDSMSNGLESVRVSFSALEVAGMTVISNLTNRAMQFSSQLANMFVFDPPKSGFAEYEEYMGSIQTIQAGTGASIKEINGYLDELNTYADKTIYSFSDMTANIGKFTNAGVDLRTAVKAIQGISNEAAVSGANTEMASRAMYNFAQALSAGYVKLIDWKSIENANMATKEFKQELIDTAVQLGTVVECEGKYVVASKQADHDTDDLFDSVSNFNDSLKDAWMTTDVLTTTLGRYSDENTEIGKKAFAAAQDVRTFSMMMDTLTEAVGSGWTSTWRMLVGDFDEAKVFWTDMTNFFSGIIEASAEARNKLLEGALTDPVEGLESAITEAGISIDDFQAKLIEVGSGEGMDLQYAIDQAGSLEQAMKNGTITGKQVLKTFDAFASSTSTVVDQTDELNQKLEYFQQVVDDVWYGKYKNAPERYQLLAEAGYDYEKVQDLVNKTVDGHRLTLEDLGEEQMKVIGYTDEEIAKFKELSDQANESGSTLNEFVNNLRRQQGGRALLIETIQTVRDSVSNFVGAIKSAWSEVFGTFTSTMLYNAIKRLHDFADAMKVDEERADKLKRIFKGLFAPIKAVATIVQRVLSTAFQALSKSMDKVNIDILDVLANIGDAVVAFSEWVVSADAMNDVTEKLQNGLEWLKQKGVEFLDWLKSVPVIGDIVSNVEDALGNFSGRIKELVSESKSAGNISDAFSGIGEKIQSEVEQGLTAITSGTIFDDIIQALIGAKDKIGELLSGIVKTVVDAGNDFMNGAKGFDYGPLMTVASALGILAGLYKFNKQISAVVDMINTLKGPVAAFTDVLSAIKGVAKQFGGLLKAAKQWIQAGAIMTMALSIVVICGAIALLAQLPTDKLLIAAGVVVVIVGVLIGLMAVMTKLGKVADNNTKMFVSLAAVLGLFTLSLVGIVAAVAILGALDSDQMHQGLEGFGDIIFIIGLLLGAITGMTKVWSGAEKQTEMISKLGGFLLKMSASMVLVGVAMAIIAAIPVEGFNRATTVFGGIGLFLVGIITIAGLFGKAKSLNGSAIYGMGKLFESVGVMCLAVAAACAIIALVPAEGLQRGYELLGTVMVFLGILIVATALTEKAQTATIKITGLMVGISIALLAIAAAMKIIAGINEEDLKRAEICVAGMLAAVFAIVYFSQEIAVVKGTGTAGMLTAIGCALAVIMLAGVVVLVGMVPLATLAKGVLVVGALSLFVSTMAKSFKVVGSGTYKALLSAAACVAVMAILVATMSLIDLETVALGIVKLAMIGAFFVIFTKALTWAVGENGVTNQALITLGVYVGIIAVLAIIVAALSNVDTEKGFIGIAGVTAILVAMTGSIAALSRIVGVTNGAMAALFAMVGIVALLAVIVGILGVIPMENTFEKAAAISTMLITMVAVIAVLSAIGPAAEGALLGLEVLGLFAVGLVAFVAILGGLCETISGLEGAIEKGLDVLVMIAGKLGEAIGAFIGGIGVGLADSLVQIGQRLSLFALAVTPFVATMSSIDEGVMNGVGAICGALLAITATDVVSSIGSFLGMGFKASDLVDKLSALGQGVAAFSKEVNGIDATKTSIGAQAANALCQGLSNLPLEGGLFSGSVNLDSFKANASALGEALKNFQTAAGDVKTNVINSAVHAGENIIELMKKVPTEGGAVAFFTGSQNFEGFATSMQKFGEGVSNFNGAVTGITTEGVQPGIDAGKAIIEMLKEIPSAGGALQALTGSADYAGFATTMQNFGGAIKKFSDTVVANGGIDLDAINNAVDGLKVLGQFCKDYLSEFNAEGGTAFVSTLNELGNVNVSKIIEAFSNSQDLAEFSGRNFMAALLRGIDAEVQIILKYCENLAYQVAQAIGAGDNGTFFNAGLACMGDMSTGMQQGFSNVADSVGGLLENAGRAAEGRGHEPFDAAGRELMQALVDGFQNGVDGLNSSIATALESAAGTARQYQHAFWQAGQYCAEGLAGGIRSGRYMAALAGQSLASAALSAAKKALDSHSPSKEFYKLGVYSGEGLSNGLENSETIVSKSATGMANSALDAVTYALSSIGTMDGSNVKIKPVLDFNNMSKYGGVLDFSAAIGHVVSSPINNNSKLIAEQMYQSNQIGKQLDKLRKEVAEISKPTYNVGGITYDDGSNVATAVRELTRAVKVERRK